MEVNPSSSDGKPVTTRFHSRLCEQRPLSAKAFELILSRPPGFDFKAGQRLRLQYAGTERDYSLASTPQSKTLRLCIRHFEQGLVSPRLARLKAGAPLWFTGPLGYFTYRPSSRPAILVATGTGIAPFYAICRTHTFRFCLLHGATAPEHLYYETFFRQQAQPYVPCISKPRTRLPAGAFSGYVTHYLERHLAPGRYDFYLAGHEEMISDVTLLVDDRFSGSQVYAEIFY